MEFRLYNHLNCSLFDLIGKHEPSQTKSLGFVLSRSVEAMRSFLELFYSTKQVKRLMNYKWIVQCETILKPQSGNKKNGRADILIGFYDGLTPKHIMLIECKTIQCQTTATQAINQLLQYGDCILHQFQNSNVDLISLTSYSNYIGSSSNVSPFGNIYHITWSDVISSLSRYKAINIIKDFLNYLNTSNGMNTYDVEVLCIPAGNTLSSVKKHGIYECPVNGRQYKKRGMRRPLYICFRKKGNNGRFDTLYKLQDVVAMDINDKAAIEALAAQKNDPGIANRINGYVNDIHPTGQKYIFILDIKNSIKLPYAVEFSSTRGMAGHVILTLKELLTLPPCPTVITLQTKSKNS